MNSAIHNSLSAVVTQRAKTRQAGTRLNLVSLMDIFTILVFFLMLNTGEVEVLQPDEKIALPKSFAQLRPDDSPVIKVSSEAIYFREQTVVSVADIKRNAEMIQPLYQTLSSYQQGKTQAKSSSKTKPRAESIAIMGDAGVNYALLKKVLYTCAQAGFRDVSLAVEHTSRSALANNQQAGAVQGVGS